MTGFGDAEVARGGMRASAVVRSVNHRTLDVRVTVPPQLAALEVEWRTRISDFCARGRVELKVVVESDGAATADPSALDALVAAYKQACSRHEAGEPRVADLLLTRPALERMVAAHGAFDVTAGTAAATEAVDAAITALAAFRAREGAALVALFAQHAAALSTTFDAIQQASASSTHAHRDRIRAAAEALLAGAALDAGRLETEVVLLAMRSDIAEELQRAREHLRSLCLIVDDESSAPRGRRLDFVLQELIRETNTMASKSTCAALTAHVVDAKTLIEQLREQAMNVE